MHLFLAGAESTAHNIQLKEAGVPNVLMSFFALQDHSEQSNIERFTGFKRIFMDSGGFSARVRGKDIDVNKYGKFLLKFKDYLFTYANLDLRKTEDTLANQKILEDLGLHPLPVFHRDEWEHQKVDLLTSYLENYDYVALGGVSGSFAPKSYIKGYLDWCFHYISKYPGKKIHGFGMNAIWTLKRYPFYSVDSTSWMAGARYGQVFNKASLVGGSMTSKGSMSRYYKNVLNYKEINAKNIKLFLQLENDITYYWQKRGVVWKD